MKTGLIKVNSGTIGYVRNENGTWKAYKTAHCRVGELVAIGKTKKVATQRYTERTLG